MPGFRVIREIGHGTSGTVLLVESEPGQQMVMKRMDFDSLGPAEKERARREVMLSSQLKHPNIINVQSATLQGGKLFILMEKAETDLATLMAESKAWPEERVLDSLTQILLGLKYLHDRKIVHRDLKPSNIMVFPSGILKIADFGVSNTLEHTKAQLETSVGTPLYLAPEIAAGNVYGPAVDCWALGVILYEMCMGTHPFVAKDLPGLMKKITEGRVPRIGSRFSPELRSICDGLMRKDPAKRATVHNVLDEPLIKLKVIALLGREAAEAELGHGIFHGFKALETPDDVAPVTYADSPDGTFLFLGRPLGDRKQAEEFVLETLGAERRQELLDGERPSNAVEEAILQLLEQLKQ